MPCGLAACGEREWCCAGQPWKSLLLLGKEVFAAVSAPCEVRLLEWPAGGFGYIVGYTAREVGFGGSHRACI